MIRSRQKETNVMPARKPFPQDPSLALQQALLTRPETNPTGYVALDNATAHPFQPDATNWSRVNGWWLADASWLAYSHEPDVVQKVWATHAGLPAFESFDRGGTQCYLVHDDRLAIVAFRGTQPDDWADLFDIVRLVPRPWDVGFVHGGFATALDRVWPELHSAIGTLPAGCRLWLTGHSLGGALALLAAVRLGTRASGLYTFGAPRIGNATLAARVGQQFDSRSIRYVNDHDVVTHVPPPVAAFPGRYTHADQLRWISPDGHIGSTSPTIPHFITEIFGTPGLFLDVIQLSQEGRRISLPDALVDHTPLYYALHTWNDFAVNG
jgi:hypothetical protein